jgi:hypothetical protein
MADEDVITTALSLSRLDMEGLDGAGRCAFMALTEEVEGCRKRIWDNVLFLFTCWP